jgi:Tol biopolymer transport system component
MKHKLKWGLLVALVLWVWLLWPKKPAHEISQTKPTLAENSSSARSHPPRRVRRHLSHAEALSQGLPQGAFEYVFDKASHANRFLFAKGRDEKFLPDSDAPSGMDLWLQDESGRDRLIDKSVTRAKFSPDGSKIAFTTSDCVLHIQNLQSDQLAEVPGVYGQSWRPDGSAVVFSKVGEGQDPHRPGTRQLTALNLTTGQMETLTDGRFDDGRPEFSPSGDSIIFVSGARSGLASFWRVPVGGGEPVQLTNVKLQQVNELFVPTPYDKTIWSGDKHWFLYDFKSGERQETWGLEFNADGTMKQAAKLAEGINPRWQSDGRTFVCEKNTDGTIQTIVSNLP